MLPCRRLVAPGNGELCSPPATPASPSSRPVVCIGRSGSLRQASAEDVIRRRDQRRYSNDMGLDVAPNTSSQAGTASGERWSQPSSTSECQKIAVELPACSRTELITAAVRSTWRGSWGLAALAALAAPLVAALAIATARLAPQWRSSRLRTGEQHSAARQGDAAGRCEELRLLGAADGQPPAPVAGHEDVRRRLLALVQRRLLQEAQVQRRGESEQLLHLHTWQRRLPVGLQPSRAAALAQRALGWLRRAAGRPGVGPSTGGLDSQRQRQQAARAALSSGPLGLTIDDLSFSFSSGGGSSGALGGEAESSVGGDGQLVELGSGGHSKASLPAVGSVACSAPACWVSISAAASALRLPIPHAFPSLSLPSRRSSWHGCTTHCRWLSR